VREK
jgi:hypothetical protein